MWHKRVTDLCFSMTSIHPCDFHPREDLVERIFQAADLQLWFVEQHLMPAHLSSCLHQVTPATELRNLCMDTLSSSDHLYICGTRPSSVPWAEPMGRLPAPGSKSMQTIQVLYYCVHRTWCRLYNTTVTTTDNYCSTTDISMLLQIPIK